MGGVSPELVVQLFAWRNGANGLEVLMLQSQRALKLPRGPVVIDVDRKTAVRMAESMAGVTGATWTKVGDYENLAASPARYSWVYAAQITDGSTARGQWVSLADLPPNVCLTDLPVIFDAAGAVERRVRGFDRTYPGVPAGDADAERLRWSSMIASAAGAVRRVAETVS